MYACAYAGAHAYAYMPIHVHIHTHTPMHMGIHLHMHTRLQQFAQIQAHIFLRSILWSNSEPKERRMCHMFGSECVACLKTSSPELDAVLPTTDVVVNRRGLLMLSIWPANTY